MPVLSGLPVVSRPRHLLAPAAFLGALTASAALLVPTTAGATTQANGISATSPSSMSANGRYVAFESEASNLVAGDTNLARDVFVLDTQTSTIVRASVDSSGNEATGGHSQAPSISSDGTKIAFYSHASNLVPDDTNGCPDVYVHDLVGGTTVRVSVDSSGNQGNGNSYNPSINYNGTKVAFDSLAANLVAGDTNGQFDVFLRDLAAGTTARVSVDSSGNQVNGSSYGAALSSDGTKIAFHSDATTLGGNDTNGQTDVFLRYLASGWTTPVSINFLGAVGNKSSYYPSISSDGMQIAFYSHAENLMLDDTNGHADVFVRDLAADTTLRASLDSSGTEGNHDSYNPSISADGKKVAFNSHATNLVSGDTNGALDVFVRDLAAGTTVRTSVDSAGSEGNGDSEKPSINSDGTKVAFVSGATNLLPVDTNGFADVFVRDPAAATTTMQVYGVHLSGSPVPFAAAVTSTLAASDLGTAASGDFNCDGKRDLVTARYAATGQLLVSLGNGNGSFQAPTALSSGGSYPKAVLVGDFNRDGKTDLACTNGSGSNTVAVLLGNGNGTFQAAVTYAAGGVEPIDLAAADFDRDGDLDLAAANYNTAGIGNVTVLLNNGAGAFPAVSSTVGLAAGSHPAGVTAADLNRDSAPDLIVACQTSHLISVFLNTGSGSFDGAINYTAIAPAGTAAADFNGDGKLDLAIANTGATGRVSVRLGTGDGGFANAVDYAPPGNHGRVVSGDFTGDGVADIVTNSYDGSAVLLLAGYGNGTFADAASYPAGPNTAALVCDDLDADGDADLVALGETSSNNFSILLNRSIHRTAAFPAVSATLATGNWPTALTVADFNRDGRPDLAAAIHGIGDVALSVHIQEPNGTYLPHWDYSGSLTGRAKGVAAGDVDRDGDFDLVTANYSRGSVTVFLNNGTGLFTTLTNYYIDAAPWNLVLGDLDNDGDLDIVTANEDSLPSVLRNNGNGTFAAADVIVSPCSGRYIALGDLNRDGNLDLVARDPFREEICVNFGLGGGVFGYSAVTLPVDEELTQPAIGDINGDGKPDVVIGTETAGRVWMLLGNGSGYFLGLNSHPVTPNPITSVQLKDLNGDGSLDLVVVGEGSNPSVMLNNGSGVFSAATQIPVGGSATGVAVADLNSDGRPDLAASDQTNSNLVTLLNTGGQFKLVTSSKKQTGDGIASGQVDDVLSVTLTHGGRVGDSPIELSSLHLGFDNGSVGAGAAPLTSAQANAVIDEVRIYANPNANGTFDPASDTLLATEGTLSLDLHGRQHIALPDGHAACQVAPGSTRSFFVALKTTPDAGSQTPNAVRVTHVTEASSKAENAANDSPLDLEWVANTSTPSGGTPLPVSVSGFELE